MNPERRFRIFLLAFWIVPALVGTLGFQLVPSRLNPDLSLGALLLSQLGMWGTWSIWSMLIWAVGNRVPFERGRLTRAFAVGRRNASLPRAWVKISHRRNCERCRRSAIRTSCSTR